MTLASSQRIARKGRAARFATLAVAAQMAAILAGCDAVMPSTGPSGPLARAAGPVGQALCELGYTAIPMARLPSGHHQAQVVLNGVPAIFLVDTGANVTALHAPLASRHGLSEIGIPAGVAGIGGVAQARLVPIDSLVVGDMPIRLRRIATTDLPILSMMPSVRGTRDSIDGILGQDVLREHRAIIDVHQHQLFLQAGRGSVQAIDPQLCADVAVEGVDGSDSPM